MITTTCKRCNGEVITNYGEIYCLQCSAPHDIDGSLIPPIIPETDRRTGNGGRHSFKRKIRSRSW